MLNADHDSGRGINRRRLLTSALTFGGLSLGLTALPTGAQARSSRTRREGTWENVIEKSSFASRTAFDREWNLLYPWDGDRTTHNGAATMKESQISLSGGVLTLTATRLSASPGLSSHPPHAPLWWNSGAVHAKEQIVVDDQFPEYDIEGEFRADTGPGVWPAFWTTGVWPSWPPESDILEYVGEPTNLFNTWNKTATGDPREHQDGDSYVTRTTVPVADPGAEFVKYRVWMYKDGDDVGLEYYLGGDWVADHVGKGWAGVPMWLIINLQMGSYASGLSGPGDAGWADQLPGPTTDTRLQARNVWVGRTRAW
ncbi:family 16 glycosylhydrolase [Nonomuraea sp. FMUSA5-5]|uniref:Family 16 glycosylhydrolase n=1 Tax=Nonomuraea composti TaxID=2720023 RepID=A0ABX1AVD5_9ACTN|nr:family 16 glycosylhydrolase [Nonomuraea sp. FMUSA5-5]